MKKPLLSLLLTLFLLLSLLPAPATAQEVTSGTCGEHITWVFEEATATLILTGTGETVSYPESIQIPWYPLREKIQKAVVSPGITGLGDCTFAHLKKLQSVSLPDGLESIGAWCFWHCESLPEIRLPGSLTFFGDFALRNCYSLASISAEENSCFFTDASGVLYTKDGKTLVRAPQKLSGTYAVLPSAVRLGADSFGDCAELSKVTLPEGLQELGEDAFYSCAALSGVRLPQSLACIGPWCFAWCNSLRTITLPEGVSYLGDNAFAFCGLNEITFTGHAPAFGADVFLYTPAQAFYPVNDTTWTEAVRTALGEDVTWQPYVKNPFSDVKEGKFYYDAVLWAVENGITKGTSATLFSPGASCTRAQILTFLWRAAGAPQPASMINPFTDVEEDDYFYAPVLWAVEKGITTGASSAAFDPKGTCTRAQAVTFLWRAAGSPQPEADRCPFRDISPEKYYYEAVLWAVEKEITTGTSAAAFTPQASCTRAQIVTFLYRADQNP